jgi:hypothetical protein
MPALLSENPSECDCAFGADHASPEDPASFLSKGYLL